VFSGAFAEKVGTKAKKKNTQTKKQKKREEGEGGEKRKRCFLLPPHLEILATKLFLVMTWEKVTTMK